MKHLEVKCYDDCNLLQTTLVKHKINEAKVAKCSSLNVGDRKSAFPAQFFLLPHIFKNDQNQNKMNTYILYTGLSFPCTDTLSVFRHGDKLSQKGMRSVCNDRMPERGCRSVQAGSVLRFYLWKEEKTQLLRKSGVGVEAGKKMPRWESTAAVRWCFFLESQTAKPCFKLLAGCFVQVHLVYVEFTSLHRHTSQGMASGPTPDTPNTPTRTGMVRGGLTVLSTASAGCPHCQCSWQG